MQRFERMVTIPEDEYTFLRSMQHVNDPLQSHFHNLTKEYKQQDAIKDPHDRVLRQGETLDEMIKTKEQLRQRLIEATPKPYQHRAESLFNFMKDKIRFNDKGEIYTHDGTVIEGSNIADLVQHAVRDRRRQIMPSGWRPFLQHLKETNAPKMVMNYDTLEELKTASGHLLARDRQSRSTEHKHTRTSRTRRLGVKEPVAVIKKDSPLATVKQERPRTASAASALRKPSTRIRRFPRKLEDYLNISK